MQLCVVALFQQCYFKVFFPPIKILSLLNCIDVVYGVSDCTWVRIVTLHLLVSYIHLFDTLLRISLHWLAHHVDVSRSEAVRAKRSSLNLLVANLGYSY